MIFSCSINHSLNCNFVLHVTIPVTQKQLLGGILGKCVGKGVLPDQFNTQELVYLIESWLLLISVYINN